MELNNILDKITPEVYQSLKQAVEIGKWPDGRSLTNEQKEYCLQAIIAYDNLNQENEALRVGYVDKTKSECHKDSPLKSSPINIVE